MTSATKLPPRRRRWRCPLPRDRTRRTSSGRGIPLASKAVNAAWQSRGCPVGCRRRTPRQSPEAPLLGIIDIDSQVRMSSAATWRCSATCAEMAFRVRAFRAMRRAGQFGLLVELQAAFVDFPVHVDGQIGQAHHGRIEAQEPCLEAAGGAHIDPSARPGRVGEGASIGRHNFDPQPHHAFAGVRRPGLSLSPANRCAHRRGQAGFRQRVHCPGRRR